MTNSNQYLVKTTQFEGPLDLLLSLIEDQKMDITQVSLAEIADKYLEYIKNRENISLAHLADFLSVAAKLILIKSKALLPLLQFDDDEEADMHELQVQLAALKAIKDIVPRLEQSFEIAQPQYGRVGMWGTKVQFTPSEQLTANALEVTFLKSLHAIPKLDAIEEKIISDVISLEKKIEHVQIMIAQRAEVIFSQVVGEGANRANTVVSFLALLELVKQKIVIARQEGAFADIVMRGTQKEESRNPEAQQGDEVQAQST